MNTVKYKLSFYNVQLTYNGASYLWNTFTEACVRLSQSGLAYLKNFSGEPDDTEYFGILKKHGFIINSQFDETGRIVSDEMTVMLNPNPERLGFTIAPGMGCNYRCIYCFEKEQLGNRIMEDDTVQETIDFIVRRLENNQNVKQLNITWFGGEPLLYMKCIREISTALINYCREHKVVYSAGIITNGRFLSEPVTVELKKLHVTSAQVSIDGTEDVYCKMKRATPLDYKCVIENIQKASSYLKINVRINADKNVSIDDVYMLIDELLDEHELDGKITLYPGFIRNSNHTVEEEKQSHGVHLKNEADIYQYLDEHYSTQDYGSPYPKRRYSSCLQACRANLCIGPGGELYRCEHYFGDERYVIGDIRNGLYFNRIDNRYYELKHQEECYECKFFPLCLEGCIDDRVRNRRVINCEKYREALMQMQVYKIASRDKIC